LANSDALLAGKAGRGELNLAQAFPQFACPCDQGKQLVRMRLRAPVTQGAFQAAPDGFLQRTLARVVGEPKPLLPRNRRPSAAERGRRRGHTTSYAL